LSKAKLRDTDFLYLTALLRAREAKMLSADRITRMLDAEHFTDAAKMAEECAYPDMSGMNVFQVEAALSAHRADIFRELAAHEAARPIVDLFRMKYDYHNVKVLVKSMRANVDAARILSDCGRIDPGVLTEAFISGERGDLPHAIRDAIHDSVSVLSRTGNPQLSDIAADKAYFGELSALTRTLGDEFISGYIRVLTDSANLRTFVRTHRTQLGQDFLSAALIPGGNADIRAIQHLSASGDGLAEVFKAAELELAVRLAGDALQGGSQTPYERACDNAGMLYLGKKRYVAFGPTVVLTYLVELEWEITALRMILSGKLVGIAPDIIRERLREGYV
jgi:V/A-type H+-transporting ATPase subunit C